MSRRAETAVQLRAFFASLKLWWYTGQVEIALGAWGIATGIVLVACARGWAISMLGTALVYVVLALAVALALFLTSGVVVPGGFVINVANGAGREHGDRKLALLSMFVFFGLFIWGALIVQSRYIALAAIVANLAIIAYNRSGQMRLFVLALWIMVVVACVPQEAALFQTEGLRTLGVVMILCGAGMFVSGAPVMFRRLMELARRNYEQGGSDMDRAAAAGDSVSARMLEWYKPEDIARALCDEHPSNRFLCACFLVEYNEPAVLPTLIRTLSDPDPMVAYVAARAFEEIWGPAPEDLMQRELKHSNRRLRTHRGDPAAEADELMKMQTRLESMEKSLEEHQRHVESVLTSTVAHDESALNALMQLASGEGGVGAVPQAAGASAGSAREMAAIGRRTQYAAAEMLGATRDHRAYALLASLLVRDDAELVESAAEGFRGSSAGAIIHLEPLFADVRMQVRNAAIDAALWVVSSLAATDAREAGAARGLLHDHAFALTQDSEAETRALSMELVSQYGEEAVPVLVRSCADADERVRAEALRALAAADPEQARAHIVAALCDSCASVREAALNGVAALRIEEALPAVKMLESDPDIHVATLARQISLISSMWR